MQHRFEVTPSCDKLRHLMAHKVVTFSGRDYPSAPADIKAFSMVSGAFS